MWTRIVDAWSARTPMERRIAATAAGLLLIALLFPPVYAELDLTGMTDGRGNMVSMVMTDFEGWTFVANRRLKLFALRTRPKDPDEMGLNERWRAMTGPSLAELRAGPPLKVAYGILLLEILVIVALATTTFYLQGRRARTGPADG